jgi:nucleoside-diphosphate-sugar epimerase
MKNEHILVTGGTGFVGGHLLDAISMEYSHITALVRKDSNLQRFSKGNINLVYGDYGSTENVPAKESDDYGKNLSPYEWSKAEAEKVALNYILSDKMPITIIRLGQLYGPRMIYGWTNVIDMIYSGKIKIIGKGNSLIQLTYIDDVINGLKLVIGNERCISQIFNMCGENIYKLNKVFEAIAEILSKPYPKSVPYYPVYILAYILKFIPNFVKPKQLRLLTPHRVGFFKSNHIYDISKAKNYFDYNPAITLQDGMKKMVEWYFSEFNNNKIC